MNLNQTIVEVAVLKGCAIGHEQQHASDESAAERSSFADVLAMGELERSDSTAELGQSRGRVGNDLAIPDRSECTQSRVSP